MKGTVKVGAGCILSILFIGCYTSSTLEADDNWLGRIPSERIEWVATKAGAKYQFRVPPVFVKDTIELRPTGERRDKISPAEISYVITRDGTKHINKPAFIEKDKIPSGNIEYAVMKDGTRYEFDEVPAILNDAIVGIAIAGREQDSGRQVSLPLVDVAEIHTSEFSTWRTLVAIPLGLYAVLVAYLLASGYHD